MSKLIDILNQNWIGVLIGIVSLFIGVLLAYAFRARSRLAARTNTLELVGPNAVLPHEIEFLFRGNKVPNVTMSRIAIWNSGNTTLKGDQIVSTDPLRIVTSPGSKILESTIRACTRDVNDFSCSIRSDLMNEAECRFDYLDSGDGALIQIIHTGDSKVKVLGTLRGVPKGIRVAETPRAQRQQTDSVLSRFGVIALGISFIMVGTVLLILGIILDVHVLRLFSAVLIPTGVIMLLTSRYMPPNLLTTQMTTTAPKKPFWRRLAEKLIDDKVSER